MYSSSKIKSVLRKVLPFLMLISILVTPMSMLAQTNNNLPASTSITFISYNGNDALGVEAFEHGQIAFYSYSLPPSEYTALPPGAKVYEFPATYYDVVVNPLNTTFGFNPFQFQQVRFALNYIVNRTYFVDSVLHGYGIPAISLYAGEPDIIHLLPTLSKYADIHYNFTYANETIYKVLTAHGAQYINGQWYYHGKPITVYVFVRTDATVRKVYAEYLITQLQKLGFAIQEIPGNLNKEISLIYGSDPANATWEIAIEAWGGLYGYYDAGLAAALYSTQGGVAPFTSYYGISMGTFNDTKYESPQLLKEANEIDNWSLIILQSEFSSEQEYYQLENDIVNLGMQMAVRIELGASLSSIYAQPNINGIYPSYAQSTLLNFQTYLSIRNGTYPNVTIGVRYLSQGSLNPVAGFTDEYSADIGNALFAPIYLTVPGTAYEIPYVFTYNIVNMSPQKVVKVPTDALWWNPEKQEITTVAPNTTAQMAVIYNFAPLFNNDKWVDNQSITLADIIYEYIIAAEASLNSSNPIYDSYAATLYGPSLQSFDGFKIINSTAIELWGNAWFSDPNYAAIGLLSDFIPLDFPYYGSFPWQMYVGMKTVVADGKAAWSTGTANNEHVHWLSLVSQTDVHNVLSALQNASSSNYIPKSLMQVENLSGVTLVTPQQAKAGYQAAISFIQTYGNAMIGDGPFILVAWNPSASPAYAKIVKSPYFHLTPPPQALTPPATYSISFSPPPTLSPGQTINGTVMETPAGSTSAMPAAGVNVTLILEYPNGTILMTQQLTTNSNGQFTFTLPSSLTPGAYTIQLSTYSDTSILINPMTSSLVVVPSVTTTTTTTSTTTVPPTTSTVTSTSTTTLTTTPTTTTTSSNTAEIAIIAVVVIIIIIIAVVLLRRRK